MGVILTILAIIIGSFLGILLGVYGVKRFYTKFLNKKLERGAIQVMMGDRKNTFEIDGKKKDVNVFIFRNEKESEEKVNLIKK